VRRSAATELSAPSCPQCGGWIPTADLGRLDPQAFALADAEHAVHHREHAVHIAEMRRAPIKASEWRELVGLYRTLEWMRHDDYDPTRRLLIAANRRIVGLELDVADRDGRIEQLEAELDFANRQERDDG
jgi:hypothetical protein